MTDLLATAPISPLRQRLIDDMKLRRFAPVTQCVSAPNTDPFRRPKLTRHGLEIRNFSKRLRYGGRDQPLTPIEESDPRRITPIGPVWRCRC
jgi:hypothetical protein